MKYQLPFILYDPECPLCLRFKQGLSFLDKSLTFISARDDEIYLAFPELNRLSCLEKVHMVTKEKNIIAGPAVVDHLIQTLPGVSKLAWLLDNEQGAKVKDYFYQKVEELRELSTKKDSDCSQCPRE
jgi:predicted DCC family thiol-disulfide oxidoreductase YuxK